MNNLSKRSKTLLIVFVLVAFSGLGYINWYNKQLDKLITSTLEQPQPVARLIPTKKPQTTQTFQSQDYTNLVKEYEGRRIHFDIDCQAIPNNVTYKNGTKIMIDNRSGDARIITVGGVQHSLAGYGYKTITLASSNLPKNLMVSCGAAVNVGQILLQN